MSIKLTSIDSGYIGNIGAWKNFFHHYINSPYIENYLKTNFKSDDPDFDLSLIKTKIEKIMEEDSVSNEEIDALEKRLKTHLPRSYKDFLRANGVQFYNVIYFLSVTFIKMLSIDEVNYFTKKDKNHKNYMKEFIEYLNYAEEKYIVENYYSYNDYSISINLYNGMNNPNLKPSNLALGELSFGFICDKKDAYRKAITLDSSEVPSAILIPDELTADGEMEAWMLEDSDIYRFRSFAEFFINNLFFAHDMPMYSFIGKQSTEIESLLNQSKKSVLEYLSLYGVDNLLDFDILKQTARPDAF